MKLGKNPVDSIFLEANQRMTERFSLIRKLLDHPGEKGSAIEETVKAFWREFLPKGFGVTSGFVIDSTGCISKQMDLIFYDAAKTPIFFSGGVFDVIPVECTFACCEIKAEIRSKDVLQDCFEKAASYKSLRRLAYEKQRGAITTTSRMYGVESEHWSSLFFVLSLTGNLGKISRWYNEINRESGDPDGKMVDSLCVVDRGLIAHREKNGPIASRKLDFIHDTGFEPVEINSEAPLLIFYMLAARYLLQGTVTNFRPAAYLRSVDATISTQVS